MSGRHANRLVILFFLALIAVVFQQIYTSMTEQGIASGGPYDNAADYPRSVAILIALMIVAQSVLDFLHGSKEQVADRVTIDKLRRPAALLVIFGVYLGLIGVLGYHLTTTPMIIAIMLLCGMRQVIRIVPAALAISFSLAFFFEHYLKVVLPGGIFGLNIPW